MYLIIKRFKNNNMNLDYSNHTQTETFTANIYIQHPVTEHEYAFMVSGTETYNSYNHYENDLDFEVCEFDGAELNVSTLMERINMTEEQLNDFVFCSIEDGTIELHYD